MLLLAFVSQTLWAQTQENIFYSNGKIYVVVAIMSIIFAGLFVFLLMIDRKIKRTEERVKGNNNTTSES
jgi:CcmD family protein